MKLELDQVGCQFNWIHSSFEFKKMSWCSVLINIVFDMFEKWESFELCGVLHDLPEKKVQDHVSTAAS